MLKRFFEYLKDEEGQTSTEYILLIAVVAIIVFKFKDIALKKLSGIMEKVFKNADSMVDDMQ